MTFNRTDGSDGGNAFPHHFQDDTPGMSLRDWLAGQALTRIPYDPTTPPSKQAAEAYKMADAMLAERDK